MELNYVYASAAVIAAVFAVQVLTRRFDPFAPVWLFLVGYVQVYIFQAITYHDWALQVRGPEIVAAANFRSMWAIIWFLAIYFCGLPRLLAGWFPRPPERWSMGAVGLISPMLIVWGLYCAGMLIRTSVGPDDDVSAEVAIFRSFPFVMLVGASLLIVSGRVGETPRPALVWGGVAAAAAYTMIWIFNGKRSHALMGILSGTCAYYISQRRRPSWPVLVVTATLGAMAVAFAIGWRMSTRHERSIAGFVDFLGDFRPETILKNFNIGEEEDDAGGKPVSHETKEYGGFLLMMDAVPAQSEHDYGASYLRIFSTFIPRVLWPGKPLFGREQWVNAWIACSELKRDATFTGPAIGILGATQLNGGGWGTAIVLACMALLLRGSYDYVRANEGSPWVQVFWSTTYFNAWFMVVGDDPFTWFYYNWGFTTMPVLVLLWAVNRGPARDALFRPAVCG